MGNYRYYFRSSCGVLHSSFFCETCEEGVCVLRDFLEEKFNSFCCGIDCSDYLNMCLSCYFDVFKIPVPENLACSVEDFFDFVIFNYSVDIERFYQFRTDFFSDLVFTFVNSNQVKLLISTLMDKCGLLSKEEE